MVHVITPKPNLGSSIGQALGAGLARGMEINIQQQLQNKQQEQQNSMLQKALTHAQQIYTDPNLTPEQKQIGLFQALAARPEVAQALGRQLSEFQGQQQNLVADQQRYDVIKSMFGQQAADLYKAAPEGGKTNIIDTLLESRKRGISVEELLGQQQGQMGEPQNQKTPSMDQGQQPTKPAENGIEKPPIKTIDFDKGLLPKERVQRQNERYSKNLPLYQESQKKAQGLEAEKDALNILAELSPKISGIERLNINPTTGELLVPGLASPEAQRFVKTVNDFTVKAKDSYGARVSNFELDRFMKRLPTLANSEEGRTQIIRQMQIINEINNARERALQDVFDEYGGIRNIDYDKAESLADKHVRPQIEELRKEFKSIDNSLEKQHEKRVQERKDKTPKGYVTVQKADGTQGYIPRKNLKAFLKQDKGNKVL